MSFDQVLDLRGNHSLKWDGMQNLHDVSPDDGLSMWVADMDFRSPDCVQDAVRQVQRRGHYGYFYDFADYKNAIAWWMQSRHGWHVEPDWIFTTFGLCNALGLALHAYTAPGDGVVLFTPVYHAFARVIGAAGREVVECPLANIDGRYEMDFDAYDARMTGREKMVVLCSPHNPGGRVWTLKELESVAAFCERHDLLLVSDEIHQDLVFDGASHIPMPLVTADISKRLIMMTAPSKTFNTAGPHCGQVTIQDPALRSRFAAVMAGLSVSPNTFGVVMTTAAYSEPGARWVDDLVIYLDENRRLFDQGINAIPGLKSMRMAATYLAWVDFSDTGMTMDQVVARVSQSARIAANQGPTFGQGGDMFMRFNFGTQRSRVSEAVERMAAAFSDLQ